jgi:hypothetical protein
VCGDQLFDPKDIPAELRQYFEEVAVQCGAPWRRVVDRLALARPRPDGDARERDRGGRHDGFTKMPNGVAGVSVSTTGWQPTCSCGPDAPIVPATVLDCFAGSGTTLMVALEEGRRAIGIDLQPDYLRLAQARCARVQPRLQLVV